MNRIIQISRAQTYVDSANNERIVRCVRPRPHSSEIGETNLWPSPSPRTVKAAARPLARQIRVARSLGALIWPYQKFHLSLAGERATVIFFAPMLSLLSPSFAAVVLPLFGGKWAGSERARANKEHLTGLAGQLAVSSQSCKQKFVR